MTKNNPAKPRSRIIPVCMVLIFIAFHGVCRAMGGTVFYLVREAHNKIPVKKMGIWKANLATGAGTQLWVPENCGCYCRDWIDLSPDGRKIYFVYSSGTLRSMNTDGSGLQNHPGIPRFSDRIQNGQFTATSGGIMWVSNDQTTIYRYDPQTGKSHTLEIPVTTLPNRKDAMMTVPPFAASSAFFSSNGTRLYMTGGWEWMLELNTSLTSVRVLGDGCKKRGHGNNLAPDGKHVFHNGFSCATGFHMLEVYPFAVHAAGQQSCPPAACTQVPVGRTNTCPGIVKNNPEWALGFGTGDSMFVALANWADPQARMHGVRGIVSPSCVVGAVGWLGALPEGGGSVDPMDTMPATFSLTAEPGGDSLMDVTISWSNDLRGEDGFIVQESTGGDRWRVMDTLEANVGSYTHHHAAYGTHTYRVCAMHGIDSLACSKPFPVTVIGIPWIRVVNPVVGERIPAGTEYTIRWTANQVQTYRVYVSKNNGRSWNELTTQSVLHHGTHFTWKTPPASSMEYLIKVTDYEGTVSGVSGAFSIGASGAALALPRFGPGKTPVAMGRYGTGRIIVYDSRGRTVDVVGPGTSRRMGNRRRMYSGACFRKIHASGAVRLQRLVMLR